MLPKQLLTYRTFADACARGTQVVAFADTGETVNLIRSEVAQNLAIVQALRPYKGDMMTADESSWERETFTVFICI